MSCTVPGEMFPMTGAVSEGLNRTTPPTDRAGGEHGAADDPADGAAVSRGAALSATSTRRT